MEKSELRKRLICRRDQLSPAEIEHKSNLIASRIFTMEAYDKAATVMFFLSFGSEVNTRYMVEETVKRGKRVLAPKTFPEERELLPAHILDWDKDLVSGAYGIPEPGPHCIYPVDPYLVEMLIVPGVAFDKKGNRIGYGGGYYDRFFTLLRPGTPLVALAYELQIIPNVSVDPWDRRVDYIVTEKQIISTAK